MKTLDNTTRLQYKKALLKAGRKPAGLSDLELEQEYLALNGEPLPVSPAPMVEEPAPAIEIEEPPVLEVVKPSTDKAASELAALIASLMPKQEPAQPVSDEKLIELINAHATKTIHIQPLAADSNVVTIEGAHKAFEDTLLAVQADCLPYLVGPAGSGKTTLAIQCAQALDLPFYSSGAVLAAYELLGFKDATSEYQRTPLRECFENGGLFLFDEIDGCDAQALVAINQLLANDRFTFPDGVTVEKHADFHAIGAANTMGTGGTRQYARNPLDMASLDRFVEIEIEYDLALESREALKAFKQYGGTDQAICDNWVARVRVARKAVESMGAISIISPRASIFGSRLLARGMAQAKVDKMVLFKSLSKDQRKQLAAAIGV